MDGEKETIIMGAAEVICCFFRRENIHNRPEISEHVHTRVPEIFLFYIVDFICAYPLFIKVT